MADHDHADAIAMLLTSWTHPWPDLGTTPGGRAPRVVPDPALAGYLCEACLDGPAVRLGPAPWGGEMGLCQACAPAVPHPSASPEA